MIRSMTAYANAKQTYLQTSINVELRSVNNRFLDLTVRIPEELRSIENDLRALVAHYVQRGKLELKIQLKNIATQAGLKIEDAQLQPIKTLYQEVLAVLPSTPAPSLVDIMQLQHMLTEANHENDLALNDQKALHQAILQCTAQAFESFIATREREGERLVHSMLAQADHIAQYVAMAKDRQPQLMKEYQEKLAQKLRDTLKLAYPESQDYIPAEELQARLGTEASLFSLRIDVNEEITRLESHCQELKTLLLNNSETSKQPLGKRLDFLFQEMNREINTLGSKTSSLEITQAVIEMKLLVEQLREQALNIE